MKKWNAIKNTRGALKRFAFGAAVGAAVVFGPGLAANAQITYDFSDGLQGWTQLYRTPVTPENSLWASYDGWGWMPDDGHLGDGWEVIDTLLGRSPAFTLNGSGALTFQLIGSASPLAAPDVAPSEIPEIAIVNGGFMGVALRDAAADTYVLSKGLSADNYSSVWTDLSFTAAELAPYANNGVVYTLDFIDYDKLGGPTGGDGWLILAGASIPGVAAVEPPGPIKKILTFGPGAIINNENNTIAWTVPYGTDVTTLAPTYTTSVGGLGSPASGSTLDFTTPQTYTISSSDSVLTNVYTVTVTMLPLTGTNTYNLGAQGSGTILLPGAGGLLPWIAMGTLPPGSFLRSFSVNARLDAADSDSWASDLNAYVDSFPEDPGTAAWLQVGGYGKIGTVETWVRWGNGDNGVGTTVTGTKTAPADFPDAFDLNSLQLSVGNDYARATWSGTITVTYDLPPATIMTLGIPGYPAVIDYYAKTIAWTVPYGTVLATLAPTFTLSSGTCIPASGAAPDFAVNNPATYTVTDVIGAVTNDYTVTVTVAPVSTACDILSFGPGAAITGTDVAWLVPFGSDVASLTPALTLSPLATVLPTNRATVDFTAPVKYTVTAQDGTTTQEYTVTVTVNVPILFGASGSGMVTFNTLPPAGQWAGLRIPGGGATATSPSTMDTLVNTLKASSISNTLATVDADQTSGSLAAGGAWNSTDLRLTSRGASIAGAGMMATLRNTSGSAINEFDLSFTLYGSAPAGEDPGLAGYALYYSLTGEMESWHRIGIYGTPGTVTANNIPLSSAWADGGTMYVLWVDDNGNPGGDGWWGFNDVTFAKSTPAADILTFDFGVYGAAKISGTNITINVPYWTDVKALAPTYTTTYGATCPQVSGSIQNFTSPVHYLVSSLAPVITKDYVVTVNLVVPSGKIYVNLDTTAREGLEGPAGGLGNTWNQVLAGPATSIAGGISASKLLDSDGLPSETGFTLQSSQLALFEWGAPSLKLVTAGAFSWNWDAPATLVINGLKADRKYDLYLASFHPNEGGSSSVFSTTNATTTVSPQLANSGGPSGNDATWEQGVNYARFENLEPDAAQNITITMVGDSGSNTIRAYLSGFQLVELAATIPTPAITGFTGPVGGQFTFLGATDIAGNLVTVMTPSLTPPIVWTPIQTNAVPGGAFSIAILQGPGQAAFFKLMGQ